MSLYQRDRSPYWVSELNINGIRYRCSTKTASKREAAKFEAKWKAEILAGRYSPMSAPDVSVALAPVTLGNAVKFYWQNELLPREQKHHTAKAARFTLDLIVRHFGQDRGLDQLTAADISAWRSSMLSQGLKPASVNRRLGTLRAVLRKAARNGTLTSVPSIDMVRLPAARDRFLSDQEFDRLRQECPPHLLALVTFLAGTGARLSEGLELRWEHVAQDCSAVSFIATKNGKARTVPCPKQVQELLKSLPRRRPEQHVLVYDGRSYESPRTAWRKARARAGLPHVTLHGLRHYYCTRLVRRGVSLLTVMRLAGHSSPAMSARYSHLAPSDLAQAVAVLD